MKIYCENLIRGNSFYEIINSAPNGVGEFHYIEGNKLKKVYFYINRHSKLLEFKVVNDECKFMIFLPENALEKLQIDGKKLFRLNHIFLKKSKINFADTLLETILPKEYKTKEGDRIKILNASKIVETLEYGESKRYIYLEVEYGYQKSFAVVKL